MTIHDTTPTRDPVDLTAVGTLIDTVATNPDRGRATFRASVVWEGRLRSSVHVGDHPPLPSDEPVSFGGDGTAPNPVEQLLGALGNCLAVGYAVNAAAAGIELRDLRIDLEGDLNLATFLGLGGTHAGYDAIRATVHVDADAGADELDELHAAVVGTSPVGHTLQRPIPIEIVWTDTRS